MELDNLIRNFDSRSPAIFVTHSRKITEAQALAMGAERVVEKHHLADQLTKSVARALAA